MHNPLIHVELWNVIHLSLPRPTNCTNKRRRQHETPLRNLSRAITAVGGNWGATRRKPKRVQAGRSYRSDRHRAALPALGIESKLPRRRPRHGSGLGKTRWVVERGSAWLH